MKKTSRRGASLCLAVALLLAMGSVAPVRAFDSDRIAGPNQLRPPSAGTWLTLVGLGAATVLSANYQDSERAARLLDKSPLEPLIDPADWYGDGLVLGIGTASILALGRMTDNDRMNGFGADLAESLVMGATIVWAIKPTVNATRPNGGPHSFPSGHTAAAFSVAPVIHRHLGWKAGVAAYTLASITGLARMEDNRHHFADVLFGAAIGIASGREVLRDNGLGALLSSLSASSDGIAITWDF